jgi:RNA polymerase sigma-70 factor (ECF subfamily)
LIGISKHLNLYLKYKISNQSHREEIVQEALIGIHQALATYQKERPLKNWVHAIAHYKMVDFIRKNKRHEHLELLNKVTFEDEDTNIELEDGLNQLPEKLRESLILTKVEGLSTKEAAQKLNINHNALRTRVSRAIELLKNFYD